MAAFPQNFDNSIESSTSSQIISAQELVMPTKDLRNESNLSIEEKVKLYFKDTPILTRIAKCESSFRHLDKKGNVLRGNINAEDIGVMQINEYYHREAAKKLGENLYTLEGNLAYAKYLYSKEGSKPWESSSFCWKKV